MHYKQLLYILPILFLVGSCGMDEEGCLDIEATNFDASADKNCCCVYPDLQLNVSHKFEELSFRLGETYTMNGVDTFIIEEMTLLFSGIHPIKDGIPFIVEDTIHLEVDDDLGTVSLEIEDNFVAIKPDKFVYPIGVFPKPETYTNLELTFGLEGDVNRINPDTVHQPGHVLASETDSIWSEEHQFFYVYMSVIPNYNDLDVKKEVILSGENNKLDLNFNSTFIAETGYDFDIYMKIDYNLLFNGIDFVADDSLLIANKLRENLVSSLSIAE